VESDLADLGIRSGQLLAWLAANGATTVHDLAVMVEGKLPEATERLLDAYGVPRTTGEIGADLAAGGRVVDDRSLASALRNRRFTHTATGQVCLAAWGPEEQRPTPTKRRRRPGPSRPARLARSDCPGLDSAPMGARSSPDRLWLWVKIDEQALRGSEAPVPVALVEGLGLEPPARRIFSSRWGPVTLAYDGTQPTRGSVRAVALAVGAHLDDTILLGFTASGDAAVEVRRAAVPVDGPGLTATAPVFFPEIANGGT
jgi:hypothetical protein